MSIRLIPFLYCKATHHIADLDKHWQDTTSQNAFYECSRCGAVLRQPYEITSRRVYDPPVELCPPEEDPFEADAEGVERPSG